MFYLDHDTLLHPFLRGQLSFRFGLCPCLDREEHHVVPSWAKGTPDTGIGANNICGQTFSAELKLGGWQATVTMAISLSLIH